MWELFRVTLILVVPFKEYEENGTIRYGLMGVTSRLNKVILRASMRTRRPAGILKEVCSVKVTLSGVGSKIWAEYTGSSVVSTILWAIAGMIMTKLCDCELEIITKKITNGTVSYKIGRKMARKTTLASM